MRYIVLVIYSALLFSHALQANELYGPFNRILSNYVKENTVVGGGIETAFDYSSAKKNKDMESWLQQQTQNFEKFDIKNLKSKEQATVFWINAYNFFMIKKILKDGFEKGKLKIDGVKSFGSFFSPYKVFKKKEFNVGGQLYSLDKIEKETLLGETYKKKGWKDARVHFAVNCASVGCPPLLSKVYDAKTVDKTLNDNVKKVLKTSRHMNFKKGKLYLTHLFKWYKKDFEEQEGSVKNFLKKYTELSLHEKIDGTKDIEYIDYDWNLNKPGNFTK